MNCLMESGNQEIEPEKLGGPTVDEVHVDFLLAEEFSVNPRFLRSFIAAAAETIDPTRLTDFMTASCLLGADLGLISVRHSVSDLHGEADLIVLYELVRTKERVAILIEDKIHAPFQPHQAKRYQDRGVLGMTHNQWHQYFTCLVAPRSYIRSDHGFQASVELEQVKEWIVSADPKRAEFKARVIDEAIQKASIRGVKVPDETMTIFRHRHYELFNEFFKEQVQDFKLRKPAPTWKGDCWFEIRHRLLPGAYINQKADRGFIDLTFPNTEVSRLEEIRSILEADMCIERTSKSAAIRLIVPSIKDFGSFDQERANVAKGLSAVKRLLEFYIRERVRLEPILASARTETHELAI